MPIFSIKQDAFPSHKETKFPHDYNKMGWTLVELQSTDYGPRKRTKQFVLFRIQFMKVQMSKIGLIFTIG